MSIPSATVRSTTLLDGTSTQFEQFMTEVTHNTPVAIQIEIPSIVTTFMQGYPELTMVTIASANGSSFSLPPWLSTVT